MMSNTSEVRFTWPGVIADRSKGEKSSSDASGEGTTSFTQYSRPAYGTSESEKDFESIGTLGRLRSWGLEVSDGSWSQTDFTNFQGFFLNAFSCFLPETSWWSCLLALIALLCTRTLLKKFDLLRENCFLQQFFNFARWSSCEADDSPYSVRSTRSRLVAGFYNTMTLKVCIN